MKASRSLSCLIGVCILLAIGFFIFPIASSFAAVPQLINYQGKLTKASGAPVDTTISMVYTIYSDSNGITSKWSETQTSVKVEKGIFNVLLGSTIAIPDSVFDGNIRYLGVKVGSDPEITPRKAMVSVPYAYRAASGGGGSDNKWIFRITDTADTSITTGGNWGIARRGATLFGDMDSTHVNLGVSCTTGVSTHSNKYCTVAGGLANTANESATTVGGGYRNMASGFIATVAGGDSNVASNNFTTVGGGHVNTASGPYSFVAGGFRNTASGYAATVGGGNGNIASSWDATVGGGQGNFASGSHATVGGGFSNTASNPFATVGGGFWNTASGDSSTIGGGVWNTANRPYAMVGGGSHNTASGDYATVGGGYCNTANRSYATVGGGYSNTDSSDGGTVGGGISNTASGQYATVGGGVMNTASSYHATVGGGIFNTASGYEATVGGGDHNTVTGSDATVGGGNYNSNSGDGSAIPGGGYDTLTVAAVNSMAFGYMVYVNNSYRVIFFDGTISGRLGINRDDHDGGISYPIHVGTSTANGNGAYLTAGGVWTNGSSRTFKEKFQTLNNQELLEKISSLPVESWNYKNSTERHIGPVAEDFVSAFDVGAVREDGTRDNKYLSTEDIAGVALAGVKELIKENQELKQMIEQLQRNNTLLEDRLTHVEKTR